jgi:hypothetical protein
MFSTPLTRVRAQIHTVPTLKFFTLDREDISDMLQRFPAIKPQHWARGDDSEYTLPRRCGAQTAVKENELRGRSTVVASMRSVSDTVSS